MWNLSGETHGQITSEWMEGGFFLLQQVDMEHAGNHIKGLEVIGHLRPFGEEQSSDIKSRFYSSTGDTLDYVYERKREYLHDLGWGERFSSLFQGDV